MTPEPKFWVICAFRNRPDLLERSLTSIWQQEHADFGVLIGDDASEDPYGDIMSILAEFDLPGWDIYRRPERMNVLGNQVALIRSVEMAPQDVLVFLDGDDRFAAPDVLSHLAEVYAEPNVDLTFGSYEPDPPHGGCQPARDIPSEVCAVKGGYRSWARHHGVGWNHLRTFRRRIFDAIPKGHLYARDDWLEGGADFAMMFPALELAGGRHRFIERTLVLYTSDREDAEWRSQTPGIRFTHRYIRKLKPLDALPPLEG